MRASLNLIALLILTSTVLSCSADRVRRDVNSGVILSNDEKKIINSNGISSRSTTAGNLVATAIREVHNLDIVLYPTDLLDPAKITLFDPSSKSETMINTIVDLYPAGPTDQFLAGTMKGKDITKLIIDRSMSAKQADLQTAGLTYQIDMMGGLLQSSAFGGDRNLEFDPERYYRVAISNHFYFSGNTFPSYRFGNGMSFSLRIDRRVISARESVYQYLNENPYFPDFTKARVQFKTVNRGSVGRQPIYQIQGLAHRAPNWGKTVTTRGIVTAAGRRLWYPFGYDFYIQDPTGDQNDYTSDGILVYLSDSNFSGYQIGDEVEVTGVIYEEMTGSLLSRTSIQEVQKTRLISRGNTLPDAIMLGENGRTIPKDHISTYRNGNLNHKKSLNLEDGIDFWESLEGMRVTIENPRVVGFRGGKEDKEFKGENRKQRGYLNLYLVPNGDYERAETTSNGGILADEITKDFNPEIIQATGNHLSTIIDTTVQFNIGNLIPGQLSGVLTYDKNLFGDGEYSFIITDESEKVSGMVKSMFGRNVDIITREQKPATTLVATEKQLTVATYNIENLAANQPLRMKDIADHISFNLKCPDIVNLVEIQDNNGIDFEGTSAADRTLSMLIEKIECSGFTYQSINIDPVLHGEGGQPGGNIRVAMIYNDKRVSFERRGNPGPLTAARIANGQLTINPSRVYPEDKWFEGTRRSLVAEFEFRNEKIILIGNHFNSKLGDTSHWSGMQPVILKSEEERGNLAMLVNRFVGEILGGSDAHVIVLGDFNSLPREVPMQMLEAGGRLKNLMYLLEPNDRYTTNHNGNSQALDYIFVGPSLLQKNPESEVPHLNSDYMGRLSDHDPVISRFTF